MIIIIIIIGALVTVSKRFHLPYLKKAGLDGSIQPKKLAY